jgi:hypothetical protein
MLDNKYHIKDNIVWLFGYRELPRNAIIFFNFFLKKEVNFDGPLKK